MDIVLIIVALIGSFIFKITKSGGEMVDDNFPQIPIPTGYGTEVKETEKRKKGKTKTKRSVNAQPTEADPAPQKEIIHTTGKKSDSSIVGKLRSPQEARRAFIYSEIFKRKYN